MHERYAGLRGDGADGDNSVRLSMSAQRTLIKSAALILERSPPASATPLPRGRVSVTSRFLATIDSDGQHARRAMYYHKAGLAAASRRRAQGWAALREYISGSTSGRPHCETRITIEFLSFHPPAS